MVKPSVSDPLAVTVHPIRAGKDYTIAVEGGVARRQAPADGVMVSLPDRDILLSVEGVAWALGELGFAVTKVATVAEATNGKPVKVTAMPQQRRGKR